MRNALLAALVAIPYLVGAASAQTLTVDEKIQKLVESLKSNQIKPADRAKMMTEGLDGIDLAKLTGAQVEKLNSAGFSSFATPEMRTQVGDRLKALSVERNVDGAVAAMLRPAFVAAPPGKMTQESYDKLQGDRRELVLEAVKHPSLAEAFKAGRGEQFLSIAASVKGPEAAKSGLYKTLAPMINDAMPASMAQPVMSFTRAAVEPDSGLDKASADKLRKTAVALLDKAIADVKTEERMKKSLADAKKQLTGAAARGELLNHPAPPIAFTWSNVEPSPKTFADFKGKVVVIDFWATWCGPCIAAFPHVREMQERYKDSPVAIVGVTSLQGSVSYPKAKEAKDRRVETKDPKDELARMPDWLKEMEVTWTVAFSEDSCFNPEFGVNGIPHIAIIDAKGVVRYNGIHPSDKTLEEKIDGLVTEAGGKVPPPSTKKENKDNG